MAQSESIMKLTEALSKAQGMMEGAVKDSQNPYFHAAYADLASCWDACREPLSKNGLAVIQRPEIVDGKLRLTTILAHSSGEWISGEYPIEPMRQVKEKGWEPSGDPQSMGSAVTYARRYSLSAMVGIASEDDDGNAAIGKKDEKVLNKKPAPDKTTHPEEINPLNAGSAIPEEEKKQIIPEQSALYLIEVIKHLDGYENMHALRNGYTKHFHEWKANLISEDMKKAETHKDELKKKFEEGK